MSCLSVLSLIDNERDFFTMRTTLLDRVDRSRSTSGTTAIIKTDVNNNQLVEKAEEVSAKRPTVTQNNKKDEKAVENRLILHYTHEKRFDSYKRDLHQIWSQTFANTLAMDVKVIVGNRNNRDAKSELVRKCPHLSLLTISDKTNLHSIRQKNESS
jgi:hypothetical protein